MEQQFDPNASRTGAFERANPALRSDAVASTSSTRIVDEVLAILRKEAEWRSIGALIFLRSFAAVLDA